MASPPGWRCTNGNGPPRRKRNPRTPSGPKQHSSFRRIFSRSHRRRFTGQRGEHDSSDDDEGFSSEDNNDSEDDADDCDFENGEEEESITPSETWRNTGLSNHPPITRSLPPSTKNRIRWKRFWFRRWWGMYIYPNARWSNLPQATTTTWTNRESPP